MNPTYEPFLHQVDDLKYKIKDALDQPNHSTARALHDDLEDLISDLRTNKHPRNIEDRLKEMQRRLREAHDNPGSYMNVEDADHFHRLLEEMRMRLRQLPNY